MTNHNRDLGVPDQRTDLDELIARVRGWDTSAASTAENKALAKALAVIAADVVRRHENVSRMERELAAKVATIDTTIELADVLESLRVTEPAPLAAPKRHYLWR
jgi:hypothetical protein